VPVIATGVERGFVAQRVDAGDASQFVVCPAQAVAFGAAGLDTDLLDGLQGIAVRVGGDAAALGDGGQPGGIVESHGKTRDRSRAERIDTIEGIDPTGEALAGKNAAAGVGLTENAAIASRQGQQPRSVADGVDLFAPLVVVGDRGRSKVYETVCI